MKTRTATTIILAAGLLAGCASSTAAPRPVQSPLPVTTTTTVPQPVATHIVRLTAGSDSGGHPGDFDVNAIGEKMTISAPLGQPNGNQRVAVVRNDATPTLDQAQCVSWDRAPRIEDQEGVILRLRPIGNGAYSAISVTKNIWGYATWNFNIHEWNGEGGEPGLSAFHQIDSFPMGDVVESTLGHDGNQTANWSMCARAVGPVFQIKVWTGDGPTPSWNDATHVRTIALPETLQKPGVSAVYAGHLHPGDVVHYTRAWNPSPTDD